MDAISNDDLAAFVMGRLAAHDASHIEQEANSNRDLACKLFVMQVLCEVPITYSSALESWPSADQDDPFSELRISPSLEAGVHERIESLLAPYRSGSGDLFGLNNRDLVDQVLQSLGDAVKPDQTARLQFFMAAGESVARVLAESAQQALESETSSLQGRDVAAQETAVAGADETTLALSIVQPGRVLRRNARLGELLQFHEEHGRIYLLSMFTGRSNEEIAELLALNASDVTEALRCATIEVHLDDE